MRLSDKDNFEGFMVWLAEKNPFQTDPTFKTSREAVSRGFATFANDHHKWPTIRITESGKQFAKQVIASRQTGVRNA